MKLELEVREKEFVNDKKEVIKYNVFILDILGEEFRLNPSKEDKKMINYLLKQLKEVEE